MAKKNENIHIDDDPRGRFFAPVLAGAIEKKKSFTIRTVGSNTTLRYASGIKRRFSQPGSRLKGVHLSKLAYNEVEKRVKNGDYKPKNKDNQRLAYSTVEFNPDNIAKNLYTQCYAIDINSCYWNVAYKLGVISEKLYKTGFKKDREYKIARNVAIGSLGASFREIIYTDGVKVYDGMIRRPYNVVRMDIIDYVWELKNQIVKEIPDGYCMFLTDCFYVTKKYRKKVIDLITKAGLEYTSKSMYFVDIDTGIGERNKTVQWIRSDKIPKGMTLLDAADRLKLKRHIFTDKVMVK